MVLKFQLPHDFFFNIFKALAISGYIIGSIMVVVPLCNLLIKMFRIRARFRTLDNGKKKSPFISIRQLPVIRSLAAEMEVAELKVSVEFILALMLIFGFVGFFGSNGIIYVFQQEFATGIDRQVDTNAWILAAIFSPLYISFPYFYVRFRVQRKRHRIALRMIMLVQNIIGHYRPGVSIADVILRSGPTMPDDVMSEWRRLEIALHMMSLEDSLLHFARRIENNWADDLVDLLMIGAIYGSDISGALHKLVQDMQTAKRNEEKRLAMITIYRLGTTFMVFAAFFIVGFNVYADGANFRHYFIDPTGKMILFISVVVMFLSMFFVIRAGKKQF